MKNPNITDWLAVHDAGYSYFALTPHHKTPQGSWKQYQTSRPTVQQLDGWSQTNSNIAIATGALSGVVVLDLDTPAAIAIAKAKGLPHTVSVKTPRGQHVYFRHPNKPVDNLVGRDGGKLPAGIDLRGDRGYVVAAGSYFVPTTEEAAAGKVEGGYSWINSPADTELADMPHWLSAAIAAPAPQPVQPPLMIHSDTPGNSTPYGVSALDAECDAVLNAPSGARNQQLNTSAFAIAGLIAGGELDASDARHCLELAASNNGLSTSEIRTTLNSAFSAGSRQPRQAPDNDNPPSLDLSRFTPPATPAASLIELTCAADVVERAIPPRQWLVQDWLPVGAVSTLFGDGGTGKSLVAIQAATAVAAGVPLWGHQTTKAPVLALYCEDETDEVSRRQQSILRAMKLSKADVRDSHFQSRFGLQSYLGALDKKSGRYAMGDLFAAIRAKAIEMSARLVILDNISLLFGDNINDPTAVTSFMSALNGLALELNGAVLLLGHISKGEGSRFAGTTAWNNAARNRLFLGRPEVGAAARNPDLRILSRDKANYSKMGENIELLWHYGALVRPADIEPSADMTTAEEARDNDQFLSRLDELTRQRRTLSIKPNAKNYAPRVIAKRGNYVSTADVERMKRTMARLLSAGVIAEDRDLGWQLDNRKPAKGLKMVAENAPVVAHPAAPVSKVESYLETLRKRA